jgi:hypothetical protein
MNVGASTKKYLFDVFQTGIIAMGFQANNDASEQRQRYCGDHKRYQPRSKT